MKNPFINPYRKRGGVKAETAEQSRKRLAGEELEKKDLPALIIAALITFLPATAITIGILVGLIYLLFMR